MRRFRGYIKTNRIGSRSEFDFEVDEDATSAQIEEIARETAFDQIEWNYEEVK